MIINIRGTSGSGKSSLVRDLMSAAEDTEPIQPSAYPYTGKQVIGYGLDGLDTFDQRDVHVVGRYETPCGGCDGIKTQDEVCQRVRRMSRMGHVVFEGLLISHIYGRYKALHEELATPNQPYLWFFLDTPLDICLSRVQARRASAGNDKPLDPTNTTQKWLDARRVFAKAEQDGLAPRWLNWERPLDAILEVLRAGV
jgi:thymidylate kinase